MTETPNAILLMFGIEVGGIVLLIILTWYARRMVMRDIAHTIDAETIAQILRLPKISSMKLSTLSARRDVRTPTVVCQSLLRALGCMEDSDPDMIEERPDWGVASYSALTKVLSGHSGISLMFLNVLIPKEDNVVHRVDTLADECREWFETIQGVYDVVFVVFSRSRLHSESKQHQLEDCLDDVARDTVQVSYHDKHTCYVIVGREINVSIPEVLH